MRDVKNATPLTIQAMAESVFDKKKDLFIILSMCS